MSEIRRCEVCSKKLKARNKKYCSAACRAKAQEKRMDEKLRTERRICKFCGEEFTPDRHHTKYCSEGCRKAFYAVQTPLPEKECPICHKMFVPKTTRGMYCSKKCRQRSETKVGLYDEPVVKPTRKKNVTPLRSAIARLVLYNERNNTNYSYGEAVARGIV